MAPYRNSTARTDHRSNKLNRYLDESYKRVVMTLDRNARCPEREKKKMKKQIHMGVKCR